MDELDHEVIQAYYTLVENAKSTSRNFIQMGWILKQFKEHKLYKNLGDGGFDTFRMFLANAELGIRPSTAYAFMKLHSTYIEKLQMSPIDIEQVPYYKLQILSMYIDPKTSDEAIEWMEKAKTLSNTDLMVEVQEHSVNKMMKHKMPFPKMYPCKVCGKWVLDPANDNICLGSHEDTIAKD